MDIKRNIDEINDSYNRRKWFIKEMKPKTQKEIENAINLSNIWVNTILLGCKYPPKTMNEIKLILDKSSFVNK